MAHLERWAKKDHQVRFTLFPPQNLPEKAVIKKKAHALTVLTLAWFGLSAFAVVTYKVGKEDHDAMWISAALWTWRAHVVFAVVALCFWVFEQSSEVRYVREQIKEEEPNQPPEPTAPSRRG